MMTLERENLPLQQGAISPSHPKRQYHQIDLEYHSASNALWTYMKPMGVPCFNIGMVEELHHTFSEVQCHGGKFFHENAWGSVDYFIIASRHQYTFNLGGDLALFITLIKSRDRDALMNYAKLCVDAIYTRLINYNASAMTISLVQGDALGGGFEFALSSNIIVAEQGARMGFPEIIFNLFPGMGAYSLLSRRIGMKAAEKMMISGNTYLAEDLEKMGVIDLVVPQGEGTKAVFEMIQKQNKRLNGLRAIYECRRHTSPVSYGELLAITTIWVDAALRLTEKDLHMMNRLVHSQRRQQQQRTQAVDRNFYLAAA
jgi:DSF synthase